MSVPERSYSVTIEDEVATYMGYYETPDGEVATDAPFADNEYILAAIHKKLIDGHSVSEGSTVITNTEDNRT